MVCKLKKYGILIVAVGLLAAMAFAGTASAEDITIENASEWMSKVAGKDITDNIILTGNIDLAGQANPMINSLSGILEGNYYTISNFFSCSSSVCGLINTYTGTSIANLTICNFNITSEVNHTGGLIGSAESMCSYENCMVFNCSITGWKSVGSFVGRIKSENSIKNCTVIDSIISGRAIVGGFVGNIGSNGLFENCKVLDSTISSNNSINGNTDTGGLVGFAISSRFIKCNLTNCHLSGSGSVGGLTGYASDENYCEMCVITNCSMSGISSIGGIIGTMASPSSSSVEMCIVSHCRFIGNSYIGGLVGFSNRYISYKNCHIVDCNVSGNIQIGGLIGGTEYANNIENCRIINSTVFGNQILGGIVGWAGGTNFSNCSAMNCSVSGARIYIGGLIGCTADPTCSFENCTAMNCRISGDESVGGLVGMAINTTIFMNCTATNCNVSGNSQVGGLLGYVFVECSFENCTTIDSHLSGNNIVGGLIGYAENVEIKKNRVMNSVITSTDGIWVGGLIGHASITKSQENTVINCKLYGASAVGGFVGAAGQTSSFDKCITINCSIYGDYNIGGGIGCAYYVITIENCTTMNSSVSGEGVVGGLIGDAYSSALVNCNVLNCSVSGSNRVGGLAGNLKMLNTDTKIRNCNLTNNIISAGSQEVGGMVGHAESANFENSNVVNCTIMGVGPNCFAVGGMVGYSYNESTFTLPNCSLKWISVSGRATVGNIVGSNNGIPKDFESNVTIDSMWINKGNSKYPLVIIAKSTDPAKQGPENPDNFNTTTADSVPEGAQLVTRLSGYGAGGHYEALAYVYETNPYLITNISTNGNVIANQTGGDVGDTIHVYAVNNPGYHFLEWNVTNSSGKIPVDRYGNFVMPASHVNAGANFTGNINILNLKDAENSSFAERIEIYNMTNSTPVSVFPTRVGYNFTGWTVNNNSNILLINETGYLQSSIDGYTNETGAWINCNLANGTWLNLSPVWTAGPAKNFTNTSGTIVLDPGYTVNKINVNGTNIGNISFAYDQNVSAPSRSGYHDQETFGDAFNITLVDGSFNGGKAKIYFNISKADLGTRDTSNIMLAHFSNGMWEYLKTVKESEDSVNVQFSAETTSFSPFLPMYMVADSPQYTPSSSSRQTGGTYILPESATPVATPTTVVTSVPETPVAPTPQPTQESPAPFSGLLAGLGAAALIYLMRR